MPEALKRGPFTVGDARRQGLDLWNLAGGRWRRVGPGTYIAAGTEQTDAMKLEAAGRRMPPGAVFSGFTAAWLHGLEVEFEPIEITVPAEVCVSARAGMIVRRRAIEARDAVVARGFRATSMARTILDLCGRISLTESVVVADMALHARLVTVRDLRSKAESSRGRAGVPMLRRALEHVEPASESPMETRLRMLLVLAGLPPPESQVAIRDRFHRFLGRPDLYYREQRVGLEYDGAIHRESLSEDNRRQNRLVDAGIRLLRFTAGDIYGTPDVVVGLVRAALAA